MMEMRMIGDGLWVCGPCWVTLNELGNFVVWWGGQLVGETISADGVTWIVEKAR